MKLKHRIQMLVGVGPRFILAEPGTDPLNEPELFVRRRRKKGRSWLWWLLGLATLGAMGWGVWGMLHHG